MRLIDLCEITANESYCEEIGELKPTYLNYLRRINGIWEAEVAQ